MSQWRPAKSGAAYKVGSPNPGLRGACHRAGHFGPDPLAPSGLRSLPPHPIAPLPSPRRIEFLAAELRNEFFRIRRSGEAVDVEPLAVVADAMAAPAQRQILAEVVDGVV